MLKDLRSGGRTNGQRDALQTLTDSDFEAV